MKPKILTVDDSKTIRSIVARAFKPFDADVIEASNGVEGLAAANRDKPDLIILDLTMPIMDGAEMLSKLKGTPELRSVPVIMLTAEAGRENVLRIARMGVRDYLIKPFKEDQLIERVVRVMDLKPKGSGKERGRRYDDPISILVVDDKPAIPEQIRTGLSDTQWRVAGRALAGEAIDYCAHHTPDVLLVSLSVPDNAAFTLFQAVKSAARTKHVPVFAMSVKTAVEEQIRAQQAGFTGIVTKPIDFDDLKGKISRSLSLDTSYKYFEQRQGILALTFPSHLTTTAVNEISQHLRPKFAEAVDCGLDKVIIDMSALKGADVNAIRLTLTAMELCHELSLRHRMVGTEQFSTECRQFEESKDWTFQPTFIEALGSFQNSPAPA